MEKEPLFEGKENTSSVNIKEFGPACARLDITLSGKISGKVAGIIMTTHNMLMKPDNTGEADFRSIIFSNGEPIFIWGKAMGKIIDPAPIEKLEENLTFQTPSKKLAYLNTTKGWADATYNIATGEYTFKVYSVK
ncbi:MAG: hypothetical protein M1167_04025 [Chloroflexi bacterium]|nr:hypothetical protein [Chloroflexota bacterium]